MSYCQVRNELRNLTRRLWTNYENTLVSGAKENPRQQWNYTNSQLKVHPSIDRLCAWLWQHSITFWSWEVSVVEWLLCQCLYQRRYNLHSFISCASSCAGSNCWIEFTPQDVYAKLSALNTTKASGPDGWPKLSLKECRLQLSTLVQQIV